MALQRCSKLECGRPGFTASVNQSLDVDCTRKADMTAKGTFQRSSQLQSVSSQHSHMWGSAGSYRAYLDSIHYTHRSCHLWMEENVILSVGGVSPWTPELSLISSGAWAMFIQCLTVLGALDWTEGREHSWIEHSPCAGTVLGTSHTVSHLILKTFLVSRSLFTHKRLVRLRC